MAIIDPGGLFGGDRLRRCSNAAQLHWPRLYLASDGFARLELNYARIVGRAYATFHPIPTEDELAALLKEYVDNYLLFPFEADGQMWGQWDTRAELLPRYKTAQDRRSPIPPENALAQWKLSYRNGNKAFPKSFGNFSVSFLHGVGVGGGKNICASGDAQVSIAIDSTQADALEVEEGTRQKRKVDGFDDVQNSWFAEWWATYWRKRDRKKAETAFKKQVRTLDRFNRVMEATAAQTAEMLRTDEKYRPYGASWLNGERWEDESVPSRKEPVRLLL